MTTRRSSRCRTWDTAPKKNYRYPRQILDIRRTAARLFPPRSYSTTSIPHCPPSGKVDALRVEARILLVDDNEVDFVFTRRMLARLASADPVSSTYEIEWASSVDEALNSLEGGRYDVCLVDYQLGDRNGLELLRESSRRGLGIPMIVLTGRGDPDIDAQAMALGASGYLDKETVDPRQLDRALRYALSRENLIQDLIDQNGELVHRQRLTELALGSSPIDERLMAMAEQVALASGFEGVEISSYEPRMRTLRTVAACGWSQVQADRALIDREVDLCPAGTVVRARRPHVEMALEGPLPQQVQNRWPAARCFVAVPLLSAGKIIGALELASDRVQAVDRAQLERLESLAAHLGLLLGHLLQQVPQGELGGADAVRVDEPPLNVDELIELAQSAGDIPPGALVSAEPLAAELDALLSWYDQEAKSKGMELHLETVGAKPESLHGDASRLRRVISTYLTQAIRYGDEGRILVQTLPAGEGRGPNEEVLVSFRLPSFQVSVREWEPCLEAGREMVRALGGQLETVPESGGGLRVLMSASLAPCLR